MSRPSIAWCCGIYRLLLLAYPREFRRRYGAEMAQLFGDECRRMSRTPGLGNWLRFLMHYGTDLGMGAVRERAAAWAGEVRERALDGAPLFLSFVDEAPRPAALLPGALISLAMFGFVFYAIQNWNVQRLGMLPLPASWKALRPSQLMPLMPASGVDTRSSRRNFDSVARGLMAQFDRVDVVALGEWHGSRTDQELRSSFIRLREFPEKVRFVVIELGNSLYQEDLDRYIRGEEIPKSRVARVWRDTTQVTAQEGSFAAYQSLVDEIRIINQSLPEGHRIRVLAGDPPIDWFKVTSPEEFLPYLTGRDQFTADLIAREVLAKGEKALVICGAGHIWRNTQFATRTPNLASLLDRMYPGRLFSVVRIGGSDPKIRSLESLIETPQRPVLLLLKGTGNGDLRANDLLAPDVPTHLFPEGLEVGDAVDGCVYMGADDPKLEPASLAAGDPSMTTERERRRKIARLPKKQTGS